MPLKCHSREIIDYSVRNMDCVPHAVNWSVSRKTQLPLFLLLISRCFFRTWNAKETRCQWNCCFAAVESSSPSTKLQVVWCALPLLYTTQSNPHNWQQKTHSSPSAPPVNILIYMPQIQLSLQSVWAWAGVVVWWHAWGCIWEQFKPVDGATCCTFMATWEISSRNWSHLIWFWMFWSSVRGAGIILVLHPSLYPSLSPHSCCCRSETCCAVFSVHAPVVSISGSRLYSAELTHIVCCFSQRSWFPLSNWHYSHYPKSV